MVLAEFVESARQGDALMEISVRKVAQVILMGHEMDRAEGELRAFLDR
jgi:hypothetical protein